MPPTSTPLPTNTPVPPTSTPLPAACTAGTVTYAASADAWIDQASAGNNFGSDSILKVQAKSSNNFRALVRFNLPASPPSGCVVQSATMRLYAASSTSGRTIQAIRVTGNWAEGGVTWANQPATTGTAATTGSGSGTGYRSWTVTSQVQAIFSSGTNNGFLIRDATEGGSGREQQFHGREKGEFMPELIVQYAAAPQGNSSATESLAPMHEGAAWVALSIESTDLFGAAGAVAAEDLLVQVQASDPVGEGSRVLVSLAPAAQAPAGRYNGVVTITWRDQATGAVITEAVPVRLVTGASRIYLPLLLR